MASYRDQASDRQLRSAQKSRREGAEAFQILVADRFTTMASVEFNGLAVAEIVRQLRLVD